MANITKIRNRINVNLKAGKRYCKEFDDLKDTGNAPKFRHLERMLLQKIGECKQFWTDLVEILEVDEQEAEEENFLEEMDQLEEGLSAIREAISDLLVSPVTEVATEFPGVVVPTSNVFSRLPKLQLPFFGGKLLDWPNFWQSFETEVHNNRNLTDISKYTYLRAQLKGEALDKVMGLSITDQNYVVALDILKNTYGKK